MVSPENPKVLTWLNSLGQGGIETTLYRYLKFTRLTNSHSVIINKDVYSKAKFEEIVRNIYRTRIRLLPAIDVFYYVISRRYDVCHSRFGYGSGLLTILCKFISAKCIVSVHSRGSTRFVSKSLFFRLQRFRELINIYLTVLLADAIVFHSKANLNYYKERILVLHRVLEAKSLVIYNGISRDNYTLSKPLDYGDVLRLVSVGSLRLVKNHMLQLEVARVLKSRGANFSLDIYGSGLELNRLRKVVDDYDLIGYVRFLGTVEDIPDILPNYNVLIHTSLSEGLGNVVIEAQMSGILVFASNIHSMREACYDVYHNFFFDVDEDVNIIVDKLYKLIVFDRENDSLRKNAYSYVNRLFNVEEMARKMDELYLLV